MTFTLPANLILMTAKPFPLRLLPKTQYDDCIKYDNGIPGTCPNINPELLTPYVGELEYVVYGYKFFSPNKTICSDQQDRIGCKLELELSKSTVNELALKNIDLSNYIKKVNQANTSPPSKVPTLPSGLDDTHITNPTALPIDKSTQQNPFITIGLPVFGGIIIFIVLYYFFTKVFGIELLAGNSRTTNKKQRSKPIQNPPRDSLSLSSSSYYNESNTAAFQDLNNKLSNIINKLRDISSRVDSLETEVCALNQQKQLLAPKSRGFTVSDQSYGMNLDTLQSITKPLSIDLLKEAVATINYDLIRNFPHFFVSETLESRQGLEENGKRFILEGDQSQAGSRTQSEFIAINCNAQTYLIPNILPNASNPERTLKRHADRNNIYRNGQGENLLKLEELAVIQRNGEHFDLISIGQIA